MPETKGLHDKRYVQIGLKIAYYRKMNGWTQDEFAEHIGISPGYLSQIESPSFSRPFSLKLLFTIADAFGILPAKLLEFDE